MGLHWQELVIILVIALVIFGPRRLPEIGRSMGNGIREFKDSVSGVKAVPEKVAVPADQPVAETEKSTPTA